MTGVLEEEGKGESAAKPPIPLSFPCEAGRHSERNEVE